MGQARWIALVALALPSAAAAATINFDEVVGSNQAVTNRYAGQGVTLASSKLPGVFDQTFASISISGMRYVAFNYTDTQFGVYAIDGLIFERAAVISEPETRNPKPETRNPKPETRNLREVAGRSWSAGFCGTSEKTISHTLHQLRSSKTNPASAEFVLLTQ